jgi:hypothetical protein
MPTQIAALRALIEQRFPDAMPIGQRIVRPVATGFATLDRALPGGGFPLGKLSVCQPQGGMTSILRAACRTVVAGGDRAAWIDGSGTVAGAFWVDDGPVLIRPKSRIGAIDAANLLLRSGGFRLVVLAGGIEPRDAALVRLIRSVHEGGGAFVALTPLATMAALRLTARIMPESYRWRRDPFGDPAEVQEVRIHVEARAPGWNGRAELSIPVQSHELRLSLEPRLADRRGLPGKGRARTS